MMTPLSQREIVAAEAERHRITAEARMMVLRLVDLMNVMSEWAEEELENDDVA